MESIKEVARLLSMAANCAPSADNSQPWRMRFDGEALELAYDNARVSGLTFDQDNPATLLAMGAAIENIYQAAHAMGIPLNEEPPTGNCYFRVRIDSGVEYGVALATDHPLFARHTNRQRYLTKPVPGALVEWVTSQAEGDARARILTTNQDIKGLAHLVDEASAIRFQSKEMHEILGRSLRFTPEEVSSGDGLDVSTFNLPPGGRMMMRLVREWSRMAALNRLGAYRLFANLESQTFVNASASIVITAPPGRDEALSAGRLLERVWIELNRAGLAVHPFYVVSDLGFRLRDHNLPADLHEQTKDVIAAREEMLGLGDRSLYMLLRVGYPTKVPVRAKRLPLEKLLDIRTKV